MDEAYCFPAGKEVSWEDREHYRVSASSYSKSWGDRLRCPYELCFDEVFFKRGGTRVRPHFSHHSRGPDAAYCEYYHPDSTYRPRRASLDFVCLSIEDHIQRLGGKLDRSQIDEGKVYVTGLPVPFVIVNLTPENIGHWVERETEGKYQILFVVTIEDLRWINETKLKRNMLVQIVSRRPVQTTQPSRTGGSRSVGLITRPMSRPMSLAEIEEHLANAKPALVDWNKLFGIELPIYPVWMQHELVTPFLELQEAVEESGLSAPGGKAARLIAKRLLVDGAGVHRAIFKQEDPERARQLLRVGPVFPLRRHLIDRDELAAAGGDAELKRLLARHDLLRQTFGELSREIDKPVVEGTVGCPGAGAMPFWIDWGLLFGEDRIELDNGPIWIHERFRPSLKLLGETLGKQGLPPRTRKALGLVAKDLLVEAAGVHQTVFEQDESEARELLRAGPVFPTSEELVTLAEVLEITRSGELVRLLRQDRRLEQSFDRLVKAAGARADAETKSLARAKRQVVSTRGELDSALETVSRFEKERDGFEQDLSKSREAETRLGLDLKVVRDEIRQLESTRDTLKRDLAAATTREAALEADLEKAGKKAGELDETLKAHKAAIHKLEEGVVDAAKITEVLQRKLDGQESTFRKRLRHWRIAFAVTLGIVLVLIATALLSGPRGSSKPFPAAEPELTADLEHSAPPPPPVEPPVAEPPLPTPSLRPPSRPDSPQTRSEPPEAEAEASPPPQQTPPETTSTEPPAEEPEVGSEETPSEPPDDSESEAGRPTASEAGPPPKISTPEPPAALLRQALEEIRALEKDEVVRGKRDNLRRLVGKAIRALATGDREAAVSKLEEVVGRVDRCAGGTGHETSRREEGRDWITDCDAQRSIHALLDRALGALRPAERARWKAET